MELVLEDVEVVEAVGIALAYGVLEGERVCVFRQTEGVFESDERDVYLEESR